MSAWPCPRELVKQFLTNPTAALDTSCIPTKSSLLFGGNSNLATKYFGTSDFWHP